MRIIEDKLCEIVQECLRGKFTKSFSNRRQGGIGSSMTTKARKSPFSFGIRPSSRWTPKKGE